ncbi:MAG: hypothetical protein WB691_16750, partial [Pseudolabrys sp.]
MPTVVAGSTNDGRVTVGGQGNGGALLRSSTRARADELGSFHPEKTGGAPVHPRSPLPASVAGTANDGHVAIGGERDGDALLRGSTRYCDELITLLGPDTAAARVD